MYKKILPLLALIPIIASAEQNDQMPLPITSRGFHIVNQDKKTKDMVNEKGFTESDKKNRAIQFFLHLKANASLEIKTFKDSTNPYDTHLKSSFSEIKLSIPFTKPNGVNDYEIIGYAAIGGYTNGWSGIRMFFEKEPLGICSYSFERFLAINADNSAIRHLINKKPSFTSIEGNYNSGFIYTVSWDDDNKTSVYDHRLECVNRNMDKSIMEKMIALGSMIDNSK